MLRTVLNFCHRPRVRFGRGHDARSRFGQAQFASFMKQNNRRPLDTDLHDAVLRSRKVAKNIFRLALIGGCAWIVLESAKALSVF